MITRATRPCFALAVAWVVTLLGTPAAAQPPGPVPQVIVTRPAGRMVTEVADSEVRIRKEHAGTQSVVSIETRTDEVTVTVAQGRVTVSTPRGTATVTEAGPEEMARLMAVLQRSDAAAAGLRLLQRLGDTPKEAGHHSLLLTRAILELGHGPSAAVGLHRRWARQENDRRLAGRPGPTAGIVRTSLQSGGTDKGPGDCWDIYAKEAIRIAGDFGDCTDDLRWYDALGWAGCSLIYTVRAEAAFWWFINCSGGFPFKG